MLTAKIENHLKNTEGILLREDKYLCLDCASKPVSRPIILAHLISNHLSDDNYKIFRNETSAKVELKNKSVEAFWQEECQLNALLKKGEECEDNHRFLLTIEQLRQQLSDQGLNYNFQETKKELIMKLRNHHSPAQPHVDHINTGVRFFLYSRNHNGTEINCNSNFESIGMELKETFVISHGWSGSNKSSLNKKLMDSFLALYDCNVSLLKFSTVFNFLLISTIYLYALFSCEP